MKEFDKINKLKKIILKQSLEEIYINLDEHINTEIKDNINIKNTKKIIKHSIKNLEKNNFEVLYILLDMNIFNNSPRLIKLMPEIKYPKYLKKYIFWNLFLIISNKDTPLKRYVDKNINEFNFKKLKRNTSVDFQLYSNLIYKRVISFIQVNKIKINFITFLKDQKMKNQEKLYRDLIKERFSIESEFILKSYYLLFDKQKGFFFNDQEIKHQALKNKLIYNLKLSI